jgi:hypothetical protein
MLSYQQMIDIKNIREKKVKIYADTVHYKKWDMKLKSINFDIEIYNFRKEYEKNYSIMIKKRDNLRQSVITEIKKQREIADTKRVNRKTSNAEKQILKIKRDNKRIENKIKKELCYNAKVNREIKRKKHIDIMNEKKIKIEESKSEKINKTRDKEAKMIEKKLLMDNKIQNADIKKNIRIEKRRCNDIKSILSSKWVHIHKKINSVRCLIKDVDIERLDKLERIYQMDKDDLPDLKYKIVSDDDTGIYNFLIDVISHITYNYMQIGVNPLEIIKYMRYDISDKLTNFINTRTGIYHYTDCNGIKLEMVLPVLHLRNLDIIKRVTATGVLMYRQKNINKFMEKIYENLSIDPDNYLKIYKYLFPK